MNILIIEDAKKIISFLKQGLKSEGFTVSTAADGDTGLFMAQEGQFDLIIMDIRLPKMDGIQICKTLRAQHYKTPIIMLTAKDSVEDRILGLDSGADDYITKPFSFSELLARIRAVKRRHSTTLTESSTLNIQDLSLNPETFEVKRSNVPIRLSATEFKLLKYLMEHPNKTLSKATLLEHVWGFDFSPESNIVEVYINYLREKIDKKFSSPLIQTAHGLGYKLCD
jgi:DNA-binding response OmpR family regulator